MRERKKDIKDERLKGREKRMRIRYRKQTVWRMRKKERVKVEYGRSREGIQERTLTLRFLGIISRVLRLEVSTIVFYKVLFKNKLEFSSLIDYLYGFLKP